MLGESLEAWRRPERARGREAHWAVAASLPEKSQAASGSVACQQFRCLALDRRSRSPLTKQTRVCDSPSWSARIRALVSTRYTRRAE